ncbi:class I SAM-dependent methyltransferase [Bacillus timonensis]|nr:class I SAM-dependent methyltransferase [Bacillus timonensis]
MRLNNKWNVQIYRLWAPVYDQIFNKGMFKSARIKHFAHVEIPTGSKVLLVGVGTGADIPYIIREDMEITGVDLSKDMLEKANANYRYKHVSFIEMDAQNLQFPKETFDVVIASLIITVVPEPENCLREVIRVTKDGGNIYIFDKFINKKEKWSIGKKITRPLIQILGTDIGVSFEKVIQASIEKVEIIHEKSLMLNGMYKSIRLKKKLVERS